MYKSPKEFFKIEFFESSLRFNMYKINIKLHKFM